MITETLTLNCIPPSLNNLYRVFRGRAILSEQVREFAREVMVKIPTGHRTFLLNRFDYFNVEVIFMVPNLVTKQGKISRTSGDVDNRWKILGDCLFTKCGEDDAKITRLILEKRSGDSAETIINITGAYL